MNKMNTCELIGCNYFQHGQCEKFTGKCKFPDRKAVADELVDALEEAETAYDVVISLTPTGILRDKVTEMNILRLQALSQIEGSKG